MEITDQPKPFYVENAGQQIPNVVKEDGGAVTAMTEDIGRIADPNHAQEIANLEAKGRDSALAKEKENMAEMMNKMIAVTRTRDKKTADYTFVLAMKYHHEGALEASKQILAYTKNPQIRKIAKNIIKDQAKEIKQFDKLIEQGL